MPTPNAVLAVINKYESLAAANFPDSTRPPIHFGEAPQVTDTGAQLRPPYVVLTDESGFEPDFQSDMGGAEAATLKLHCLAKTLADAASIANAVKWNGQPAGNKAGLDSGTLTIDSPLYAISLIRTNERSGYENLDKDGARVHYVDLIYHCVVGLDPAA